MSYANLSYKKQVIIASEQTNISIVILDADISKQIRKDIYDKFTPDGSQTWNLWDRPHRSECESVSTPDGWQLIGDFVGNTKCLLFFNENGMIEFASGKDLITVIGETYIYEFYVTTYDLDYVVCLNHHDFLIAFGTARSWAKTLSK